LLQRLAARIDRGLEHVSESLQQVREYVVCVQEVASTLDPATGDAIKRRSAFEELRQRLAAQKKDEVLQHMAKVMSSFAPGLFVSAECDVPRDNLDLERWFRLPKRHERLIHGRRHAGVRPVQEGPTLTLTLDAHYHNPLPLTADDLLPYRRASSPPSEEQAMQRRKVMRQARSKKKRPALLADLENRYRDSS
jgi:hypothetical protein